MASIFTYDPDPQRVSSPWLSPADSTRRRSNNNTSSVDDTVQESLLSDYGLTKLEAEPQDGPTEYKLHLLLRPRRAYTSMTTTTRITGSHRARHSSESKSSKLVAPTAVTSAQSRQHRLEQLTTQLLWRLQQSSPYHASTSTDIVVPKLPEDAFSVEGAARPDKPVSGLEESRGALYEIGVSDDGTLVGLTRDELDESITTLRIMATSLGCEVEVLRMVIVGEAEWEEAPIADDPVPQGHGEGRRTGSLWVAEALVTPQHISTAPDSGPLSRAIESAQLDNEPRTGSSTTEQLRVTLTGPTTSGKSTLLGTLSTGTLDNGRGTSRLSLLKHRHEVASGVTSSVAQELIGYKDGKIFNYSHANIESWVNVHDRTEGGRLVFVSDSAGHPRYRRTILRGLVGWAPHWTILCIGADVTEEGSAGIGATSSAQEVLGAAGAGVDLPMVHLDLCLKLEAPLAIVITKLDLVARPTLQRTLGKVLSAIKSTGRAPRLLQPDPRSYPVLAEVPLQNQAAVKAVTDTLAASGDFLSIVPIVLASAVKGTGIGMVHALLQNLPLPPTPTSHDYIGMALNPEQPATLFHIDDKFSLPAAYASVSATSNSETDLGTVVSGYLRFGRLSVNDKVLVGPFPSEDDIKGLHLEDRPSPNSTGLSISHPSSAELSRIALKNTVSAASIKGEWHSARVVSIRNLRLPVQTLEAGQVGTVGLVMEMPQADLGDSIFEGSTPTVPSIRKGMVVAIPSQHMIASGISLQAASGLIASFRDAQVLSIYVGSLINIYVASVRAAARVTRVSPGRELTDLTKTATEDIDDVFDLNELVQPGDPKATNGAQCFDVTLDLLSSREWIELGSRIVLLEGGRNDRSGLEGFVGKVVEIFE